MNIDDNLQFVCFINYVLAVICVEILQWQPIFNLCINWIRMIYNVYAATRQPAPQPVTGE